MKKPRFNSQLFRFIDNSPTPFHAAQVMSGFLKKAGFRPLQEVNDWNLERGRAYFTVRDDGSLICFCLGKKSKLTDGFRLLTAHTDSPSLKIKPQPEQTSHCYLQLGVEAYGSPLLHPWFDRELGIAGRIRCETGSENNRTLLLDFNSPVALIPSVAIHLNREANKESSINPQKDLPLLFSQKLKKDTVDFNTALLHQSQHQYPKVQVKNILSHDLFCYDCLSPTYFGVDKQYISGPRLDNLVSCFIGIMALIKSKRNYNSLLICSNHEEVGSVSVSGANSSFLSSCFDRIFPDPQKKRAALARSFMISMDNAHALHPNAGDASDENHHVLLNHGPVIKYNANQRYTTNSISSSVYKTIASESKVKVQEFVMRSDLGCGSTIGPLLAAQAGVQTVDIGVASLGMHSIRETIGGDDPHKLYSTIAHFLNRTKLPDFGN